MNNQYFIKTDFKIRNANRADLDNLMMVEQTWPPDQRATADQFLTRLERFPEGFWVVESGNIIVGLTTSCLLHYDPDDMAQFSSWNQATNNGFLYPRDKIAAPNALYVVSTVIVKEHRGKGLFEALFGKHKEVTGRLGLAYSLTGAMLPGYNAYCRKYGEISAYQYAIQRFHGRLVDPLIRKLAAVGYEMPDQQHLIANYFQSLESRDYAALLVYNNLDVKGY
jgi:hypothetical protein